MKKIIILGIVVLMLSVAVSAVTTKLPIFEGGRIAVSKPGYFTAIEPHDTEFGEGWSTVITLEPYRNKNIIIKKYNIVKNPIETRPEYKIHKIGKWGLVPIQVELSDREQAIFSITRIKQHPYEEDLFNVIVFSGGQEPEEIKLVPGKYEVEISLYYEPVPGSIMIPEDWYCYRTCPICSKKCIKIPEIEAPSIWPLGTVKYTWTVNSEDLKKGNNLEFYGVSLDLPGTPLMQRKHRDLENIDKIDQFIRDYSILLPKIK